MYPTSRPWWQQVTALVSLSAGGAVTGFSFVPRAAADLKSPASMPIQLLALEQSVKPAPANDTMLRSAIVNVAHYYLRMGAGRSPAEMEALIWQHDSVDGADHGAWCAAFASLTLELAAHVVGGQSWVTGGTSYPWQLHKWADVRVDPNPASLGVTSVLQDAEAAHRWHPLGDGYEPLPGDWVLFDGHVEVVTKYTGGTLHTIGGDSVPNYSVNAHEYPDPLSGQGVVGFVNNGEVPGAAGRTPHRHLHAAPDQQAGAGQQSPTGQPAAGGTDPGQTAIPGASAAGQFQPEAARSSGGPAIPGMPGAAPDPSAGPRSPRRRAGHGPGEGSPGSQTRDRAHPGAAVIAGVPETGHSAPGTAPRTAAEATLTIPGLPITAHRLSPGSAAPAASRAGAHPHHASPTAAAAGSTAAEQAFIGAVAPGAVAAQQRYGVPASVTIAQAIDESGWGRSNLATQDHNLFGIKGAGPAGSASQQSAEYVNGQPVTSTSSFRVYRNAAESIDDHGRLLASSQYYRQAMADHRDPNAFAADLTGVYATDPGYGAKLIHLMQRYDLYRYDTAAPSPPAHPADTAHPAQRADPAYPAQAEPSQAATPGGASIPGLQHAPVPTDGATPAGPAAQPTPGPGSTKAPGASPTPTRVPGPTTTPPPVTTPGPVSTPGPTTTVPTTTPGPTMTPVPAPTTRPSAAAGPATAAPPTTAPGPTGIPGPGAAAAPARLSRAHRVAPNAVPSIQTMAATRMQEPVTRPGRVSAARPAGTAASRYQPEIPASVRTAFTAAARVPLMRAESLYRDVASHSGVSWELLAACDWMQCDAQPRFSPVHGEKLGSLNPDGTIYRTKSEALEQCADDLVDLAGAVYRIDLTARGCLSIRDLANVFAAFRWGGLLKAHRTSAMEFPYSVAGLTAQHLKMRWPNIDDPNTPDKPGSRFRRPFGAVPIVLCLNYPATV